MDRSTEATLTLTIPCFVVKSSTSNLSFPIFEIVNLKHAKTLSVPGHGLNYMVLGALESTPIVTHVTLGTVDIVAFQHGF